MKKVTLPDVYTTQAPTAIVIYTSASLPEDWLFSYFDGQYLSGKIQKQERYMDRGAVMSSLNNDSSTLPNGNVLGEEIKLGILKNGKTYELNPATILLNGETVTQIVAGNFSIYYAHDCEIGDEITTEIKETPYVTWYYSQCPVLETLEFDAGKKVAGDEFYIDMFRPKFCKSFTYKIIKGTGSIKYWNKAHTYKTGAGDPVAGEVILQINVVPFDECNEDNTVFSVKILFEQPTSDFRYPDLTKREWQLYMKYYFKAFPTGDTLKLCYGIYRPGWKDKPLPELRFEVIAGGRISRTVETRETTAEYPCETFALPDDFKWVIVTEKAHGYKVSYDKNGKYRLLPS